MVAAACGADDRDPGAIEPTPTAATSEPAAQEPVSGSPSPARRRVSPRRTPDAQYWIDAAVVDADRDGRDDLFLVEWEPSIGSVLFRNRSS